MNYFELYELPVSFKPNQAEVKKKFYALSKQFHPDFYINESEEKQNEILELSTLNNKAYQVLSNEQKRIAYVLSLYNEFTEGEKYDLPADFLMEMMEVNEALMELEFDFDLEQLEKLKNDVSKIEDELKNEFDALAEDFINAAKEQQSEILKNIKNIFYRSKYLLRIQESINTFATRSN